MDFSYNVLKTLIECNENKSKKIQTKLQIDSKLENIKLYTDENRLKQILLNFISNAFKFTQQGYIKLKAKYIIEHNLVEISVKDTGLGIKEEDHDLIFKENVHINVDNEYNTHGSGLGLSIVKNMAKCLNYKIGFKFTCGRGSKFYIRINCNNINKESRLNTISYWDIDVYMENMIKNEINTLRSYNNENFNDKFIEDYLDCSSSKFFLEKKINEIETNRTKKVKYLSIILKDSTKMITFKNEMKISRFNFMFGESIKYINTSVKLVVVYDHKFVRENTVNLLKISLKNYNSFLYEILECSDGIELLNIIRLDTANLIKLILVDENMEYLNGSERVKIIRKLQENKKINIYQIVSITAFDDEETKKRISESGVNSIINKPCNKSDLSKLLNEFFIYLF